MKIAVMQPYFFPYLGYYQLVTSVDHFVILDDVTYITRGWINRNRILLNQMPAWFTVPLSGASQNVLIKDLEISPWEYPRWRHKFLKSLAYNYKHAPFFKETIALLEETIPNSCIQKSMSGLAVSSIVNVLNYIGIGTAITYSSDYDKPEDIYNADRIIYLCKQVGATTYINAIGGRSLYDENLFREQNISLKFILPPTNPSESKAPDQTIPLSIIHTLMHHSQSEIREILQSYRFASN